MLYDMGVVVAWERRGDNIPAVELKTGVPAPTEFGIRFLDHGKHVLVSANQFISYWELDPNKATRKWTFDARRRVTSLVPFNNWMAVGTANGIIAVMDLHRLVKQPFSSQLAPTIVKEFNTVRNIQSPNSQHMGIRGLCADPVGLTGWIRLKWVTSCGWHLSSLLDCNTLHMEQVQVDHSMPRMQCEKAGGDLLPELSDSWSMPVKQKVLVEHTAKALFWEQVPTVTQILPGHDSRADGDDVCRYVRSEKPSLVWMNDNDNVVHTIPLSKSKGTVACFAVHPQLEWIVVGTQQDQLYVINSRAKMTAL